MTKLSPEDVRILVGTPLTDTEASALADWYQALSSAVASFPSAELKGIEPPLRSTSGPRADA
jgi:hypothetical protein